MSRLLSPLLLACVAACGPAQAPDAVQQPAVAAVAAAPAAAQQHDAVLLDFRADVLAGIAPVPPDEQQRLLGLVFDGAVPQDAGISARIDGSFTAPGVAQQAVVAVAQAPSSADPFPAPPTLAILEDGNVVARHAFGKDEAAWQWPLQAADLDADGVDELLLAAGYTQMGETGVSLLVASLKGGKFSRRQVIENVYADDCMARANQATLGQGRSTAAVLEADGRGGLRERWYAAPCGRLDADGNPQAATPGDYQPLAGQPTAASPP